MSHSKGQAEPFLGWKERPLSVQVSKQPFFVDGRIDAIKHYIGAVDYVGKQYQEYKYGYHLTWVSLKLILPSIGQVDLLPVDVNVSELRGALLTSFGHLGFLLYLLCLALSLFFHYRLYSYLWVR